VKGRVWEKYRQAAGTKNSSAKKEKTTRSTSHWGKKGKKKREVKKRNVLGKNRMGGATPTQATRYKDAKTNEVEREEPARRKNDKPNPFTKRR